MIDDEVKGTTRHSFGLQMVISLINVGGVKEVYGMLKI